VNTGVSNNGGIDDEECMTTVSAILPPRVVLSGFMVYASQGSIYALDASNGTMLQSYPTNGLAYPTVVDDILFLNVHCHPDYLIQALRVSDGSLRWSYRVEGRLSSDAPATVEGGVYVSTVEGMIYALRAHDGSLLWRAPIDLGPIVFASPTVVDEVVYVAPAVNPPRNPFVYALRASDGTLLWKAQSAGSTTFPLTVLEQRIYLSTHRGCAALRASDGSAIWEQETRGRTCSPPIVINGRVYLSLSENKHEVLSYESGEPRHWQEAFLCALDSSDGSLLWEQQLGINTGAGQPTTPLVTSDTIYIGNGDGSLSALQAGDGIPRWHYKTGGALLSSPVGVNGVVYVGANDGFVYALRANDGTLLWQTFVGTVVTVVSSVHLTDPHG
jgi:eukaryotic-like serine/threonine-protein kinase